MSIPGHPHPCLVAFWWLTCAEHPGNAVVAALNGAGGALDLLTTQPSATPAFMNMAVPSGVAGLDAGPGEVLVAVDVGGFAAWALQLLVLRPTVVVTTDLHPLCFYPLPRSWNNTDNDGDVDVISSRYVWMRQWGGLSSGCRARVDGP